MRRDGIGRARFGALIVLVFGLSLIIADNQPGRVTGALDLYPNLSPLTAYDVHIETVGATKKLRFSTTSWNGGLGPLELIAGATNGGTLEQEVYQRIYADDGSHTDVLAGNFVWHQGHNHFHFERYADYILQRVGGPEGGLGDKTTFCILDTDHIAPGLPGSPPTGQYNSCGITVQGMSLGWGDTYGSYLAGQEINVTGLPTGDYQLTIDIDPADRLLETNDADNSSVALLRLNVAANSVQVLPDADTDGITNAEDNCPNWANTNQSMPQWPVGASDPDCDGFTNAEEAAIGTNSTSQCPATASQDAWPPDIDKNRNVSVTDVLFLKPWFTQSVPPAPARYDLEDAGWVSITDVVEFKPFFAQSCTG